MMVLGDRDLLFRFRWILEIFTVVINGSYLATVVTAVRVI